MALEEWNIQTIKKSRELYILTHAKWVLLEDSDDVRDNGRRYNYVLRQYLDSTDWIKMYLDLDPKFPQIRELRQLYEDFNKGYIDDPDGAYLIYLVYSLFWLHQHIFHQHKPKSYH